VNNIAGMTSRIPHNHEGPVACVRRKQNTRYMCSVKRLYIDYS